MTDELNQRFAKTDAICFRKNKQGLTFAALKHANGASCEIYLFGAHVTSWKDVEGKELLFLSPLSDVSGKKAIRGGIPLVFPQFGPGKLPSHGFARTSLWEVESTGADNNQVSVTFSLRDSEATRAIWPHAFRALFTVSLSDKLTTEFCVENTGSTVFSYQEALHSYFSVSDIRKTEVVPFQNLDYLDNLKNRERFREEPAVITFESETDRIYLGAPDTLKIIDRAAKTELVIEKSASKDAVVWNPWIEKSKSLVDLEPTNFERFVCVETGNIFEAIALKPGKSHTSRQVLQVRTLA